MFKKIHVFRVMPGLPLLESIKIYCDKNSINSAVVLGIIGSLNKVTLAFLKAIPGKYITKDYKGPLELVSAQGTVAMLGKERWYHIHITASDEKETISGHLKEAEIFTTGEVVLGELSQAIERYSDSTTGLNELK